MDDVESADTAEESSEATALVSVFTFCPDFVWTKSSHLTKNIWSRSLSLESKCSAIQFLSQHFFQYL